MSSALRLGLFGRPGDAQLIALRQELARRGAQVWQLDSQGINQGQRWSFDGRGFVVDGRACAEVTAWHLRHLMAPLPPAMDSARGHVLYADWFVDYMQRREKQALQLSLFEQLRRSGALVVNAPGPAGATQLKSVQLAAALEVGLRVPATCTTNDPEQARLFAAEHPGCVIKPSIGGGPCRVFGDHLLPLVQQSGGAPVTLQQRITGRPLRVTWVGAEPVVSVAYGSQAVDLRQDPLYRSGEIFMERVALPDELRQRCAHLLRVLDLQLAGVDLIEEPSGAAYFLEANPSPVYLDIEERCGLSITGALADLLLGERASAKAAEPPQSAVAYALPFAPDVLVGQK